MQGVEFQAKNIWTFGVWKQLLSRSHKISISHSNRWLEYLLEIEPGNFTDPQTSYMDIGYEYWKLITCHILKVYTSPRRHLSNFHLQAAFEMRYLISVSNPGILDKWRIDINLNKCRVLTSPTPRTQAARPSHVLQSQVQEVRVCIESALCVCYAV